MSEWEMDRCDASEIAAVLVQAAEPESRLLLDAPVCQFTFSTAWMTTSSLWRIGLWRDPEQGLMQTLEAWAPDHRSWVWGCQRRWAGDGSVVEPLDALTAQQRSALEARLLRANCWPQTAICPLHVPGLEVAA